MNTALYKSNILVQQQDLGLWAGDIRTALPTIKTPYLEWRGPSIDRETFRIALAFLKWTYDEHKVEGQARFFFNPETMEWKTVVLPQYVWSMGHTREIEDDDANPANLTFRDSVVEPIMQAGFGEAGTIHHHGNGGAYQSGGDKEDELSRNGFHVTVGNMGTAVADFHARVTLKGILYEMEENMFNVADFIPGMRTKRVAGSAYLAFNPTIAKYWLDLTELPEFPEVWKTYLVGEKKVKSTTAVNSLADRSTYESASTRIKRVHANDPFVYKDSQVTVWLLHPSKKDPLTITPYPNIPTSSSTAKSTTPKKETNTPAPQFTAAELRKINNMSPDEFQIYLELLNDKGQVSMDSTRDDLQNLLRDTLATFRDEYIFDDSLFKCDLEEIFKALQLLTTQLIRHIDLTDNRLKNSRSRIVSAERRSIMTTWMNTITEKLIDFHPEDWEQVFTMATDPEEEKHFDFYELMCEGLVEHIAYGVIEDVYMIDGTVNPACQASRRAT